MILNCGKTVHVVFSIYRRGEQHQVLGLAGVPLLPPRLLSPWHPLRHGRPHVSVSLTSLVRPSFLSLCGSRIRYRFQEPNQCGSGSCSVDFYVENILEATSASKRSKNIPMKVRKPFLKGGNKLYLLILVSFHAFGSGSGSITVTSGISVSIIF